MHNLDMIFRKSYKKFLAYLCKFSTDMQENENIIQEAFLYFFEKNKYISEKYIFMKLRHAFFNAYRIKKRLREYFAEQPEWDTLKADSQSPEEILISSENIQFINNSINELKPIHKNAILSKIVDTPILHINHKMQKNNLHRARKKLRAKLASEQF